MRKCNKKHRAKMDAIVDKHGYLFMPGQTLQFFRVVSRMSLANYDRRYKRAQRETVIINRFKTKTDDTIKTLDDIIHRYYEFKLKDETVMGQITDIKPNEKDMIIVVDGK